MGTYNSTQRSFFFFLTLTIMATENSKTVAREPIFAISANEDNTTSNAHGDKWTQ